MTRLSGEQEEEESRRDEVQPSVGRFAALFSAADVRLRSREGLEGGSGPWVPGLLGSMCEELRGGRREGGRPGTTSPWGERSKNQERAKEAVRARCKVE